MDLIALMLPLLIADDPFADYRAGFVVFVKALLGVVCLVALAVTVYHVIQGERDSAQKMFKWVVVSVVGFVLVEVLQKI